MLKIKFLDLVKCEASIDILAFEGADMSAPQSSLIMRDVIRRDLDTMWYIVSKCGKRVYALPQRFEIMKNKKDVEAEIARILVSTGFSSLEL